MGNFCSTVKTHNVTAGTFAADKAQVVSTGDKNSTDVTVSHSQKNDNPESSGQGEILKPSKSPGCTSEGNMSHSQEVQFTAIQRDPSIQNAIKLINRASYDRTYTEVLEGFQSENIFEPESDFMVFPQIAEVPKFYKGIDKEKSYYKADLEAPWKNKERQYFKERLFEFGLPVHKTLSFNDLLEIIFNSKNNSKQDIIGIFSQAGSGKTTIMKRAAAAIMQQSGITLKSGFQSTVKKGFELVIYRDFKSIQPKSETTLKEMLFGGYLKDDEAEYMYNWVTENQLNVTLFFDGYDQASWTITEDDTETSLGPLDRSSTQIVMGNLLSRKLLPCTSIVISSREFKAASLPCETRPNQILTLMGFSDSDAEMLFNKLVLTKHESEQPKAATEQQADIESNKMHNNGKSNPWMTLHSSSLLHSFLRIPVFLIFAAIIFTSNKSIPSTVTGMIFQILQLLHSAKIVQQHKCLPEIIKKLKPLAYEGMVGGYVLFKPEHFKKHDLEVKEVSDLLLGTPKNKCLNQRLMESDFFLFFCHQSIQEFLSACFIAEMDLKDFQNFVKNNIHQPRWSVVRRFVFGIVYNLNDENFVSINNREQKKKILFESLTSEVVNVKSHKLLEIFQTLCESNDDGLIRSHIHSIDLDLTPLGTYEIKLLSYILSRCSEINDLKLWDSGLNDELLQIMKNVNVSISSLNLEGNQISFSTLNCFLDNLQIGELELSNDYISGGGLNWKNISKVRADMSSGTLIMTNRNDSIEVELDIHEDRKVIGLFNKDNETLEIEVKTIAKDEETLFRITVAEKFLQPTSVNFNSNITLLEQQYLEYEALEKMLNWNVNCKISEVILNCRNAQEISPDMIESFKKKYQVRALDVVIRIRQTSIAETFNDESTFIKIHVWEQVKDQTGIKELVSNLKDNKADNLTVVPAKYTSSTEDIDMLIKGSQSKALTVVVDTEELNGLDRMKLVEVAESSSVKLHLQNFTDIEGAWNDFFLKVFKLG